MAEDITRALRDPDRLAALRETALLDTPPEESFDRWVRLAARLLHAQMAQVSLVDEERHFCKACVGLPEPWASRRELPLDYSLCKNAVAAREPLVIEDAREHPLTRGSRATSDLGMVAYLGIPLIISGEHALGALSVADRQPRRWTEEEILLLKDLAAAVMAEIELRMATRGQKTAQHGVAEAERRTREETALRRAIEAVNASFTVEGVIRQIGESALDATDADGAYVERIDIGRGEVEVVAVAGERTAEAGARLPYPGSFTEDVVERGEPEIIRDLAAAGRPLPTGLPETCGHCSAVAVPLVNSGEAIGAFFLLRAEERPPFRPDEIDRAHIFGTLAALAFRKIHLLKDSEEKREELERVMGSRERLVRGFTHDLKNPLGAADGYAQLLEMHLAGALTEKQRESIGRIRRSIRIALDLIDDLGELARAEAGELKIEWQPVDVREAARDLAEEFRAQAEAKGLTLAREFPDELPLIQSDAARVRQILGNLISNAVKYTGRGGITVRIGVLKGGKAPGPGRWVATDVRDTGPGISEEQQKLLFQEFRRLETAGQEKGAGIGLAISRSIARALDGDITVESKVGKGSTFTLWLPAPE